MRRSIAATLTLTCMGISAGVAASSPPVAAETAVHQVSTGQKSGAGRYSRVAHEATNKQRTAQGLKRLRRTDCVQRFAVKQAKVMAAATHMDHQELQPILDACGLSAVGENVAYGFPNGRAVVRGWMNSEGHRANILNPDYKLMGIGARQGADGLWYVSQVFGRKA